VAFVCPVCGYPNLEQEPHGKETGASYEICPSCFFQFGFDDDDKGITGCSLFVEQLPRAVAEV
jgi:hypothetical protein